MPLYEPKAPESCVAESSKLWPAAFDIAKTEAMHTPVIKDNITAYSTAVAPSSEQRNRRASLRIAGSTGKRL